MGSGRIAKLAKVIPDYPGRKTLETALKVLVEPVAKKASGAVIQRLLGYWVMAHGFGGRDALVEQGFLSKPSVYRSEKEFLETFGISVADLTTTEFFGRNVNAPEGLEWDALMANVIHERDKAAQEFRETGLPIAYGRALAHAHVAGLMDFELYADYPDDLAGWIEENLGH